MSALTLFTSLPITKEQRTAFIDACITEYLSGEIDPLAAEVAIKNLEDIIKAIRSNEDVKAYVLDEAEKYGKSFDYKGAHIAKSSRTTYDFAPCNDAVYDELIKQQEQLKKVIKAREEVLKSGIDPVTGETFSQPHTSVSEFLTIKFK